MRLFTLNSKSEIWLPLGGFEGADVLSEKYRVSSYGKIYNILNHRFMKLSLCGNPQYYHITLSHRGIRKTLRVHRLVAMSFISNPLGLPIVDHKDRDRLHNHTSNLRWVTRSQNALNSDRSDNKGDNHNKKQGRVKYKGVAALNQGFSVICGGEYYGACETEEIAAKVFDVISREKYSTPYLNYPEEVLCDYTGIYNFLKRKVRLNICEELKKRIIYKWEHEYVTQKALGQKYNIPVYEISKIVKV